jgi:hypothetical protein
MVEASGIEKRLYFRFHDPRVLRVLLSMSADEQRRDFFGPIERFIFEGEAGEPARVSELSGPDPEREPLRSSGPPRGSPVTRLRFSEEQMKAFAGTTRRQFKARLRKLLMEHWSEELSARSPREVDLLIEAGLASCARHGFSSELDISTYLNLVCALGPDVDERHEWARAILSDRTFQPEQKLRQLVERARLALLERSSGAARERHE